MSIVKFDQQFGMPVCGIDEVGRGPLAGPVVAACVMVRPESARKRKWYEIRDSKLLSAKKREELHDFILEHSYCAVAEISPADIDRLNIHHATLLAMKTAYEKLHTLLPGEVLALVDGKFAPKLPCRARTIIKGDSRSVSIGAASILAKVVRDARMRKYHAEYPHYDWHTNAGYGTKAHLDGLQKFGLTPYHRTSFGPCAMLVSGAKAIG
jgi:ribonuclease HII